MYTSLRFCGEQEPKLLLLALDTVYLAIERCTSGEFPIAFPNLYNLQGLSLPREICGESPVLLWDFIQHSARF